MPLFGKKKEEHYSDESQIDEIKKVIEEHSTKEVRHGNPRPVHKEEHEMKNIESPAFAPLFASRSFRI